MQRQLLFVILIVAAVYTHSWAKYGGGSGTVEDPFQIGTAEHLISLGEISEDYDKCYILTADLDLNGYVFDRAVIAPDVNHSSGYLDSPAFTGIFDGNSHVISNLSIVQTDETYYVGLFGYVSSHSAEIKNLGVIDPNVDAGTQSWVGSLVGLMPEGGISNCYIKGGYVSGRSLTGGLVGSTWQGGRIINCYSICNVRGTSGLGGLVGHNAGTIIKCSTYGSVLGASESSQAIGGLVGWNTGTITKCISLGNVTGIKYVGGLVGKSHSGRSDARTSFLVDCYSACVVIGDKWVGGLVGLNGMLGWNYPLFGDIINCYSVSIVQGDENVGGLLGKSLYDVPINSYWNIETSGTPNMCGVKQYPIDYDNSFGKTTAQMKQQSTFTDWDFINVWNIGEGQTYPYLRTHSAADINKDRIVSLLDLSILSEQWLEHR